MIFLPGVSHQKTQISALQFMTVAKSQLQSSKKKKSLYSWGSLQH